MLIIHFNMMFIDKLVQLTKYRCVKIPELHHPQDPKVRKLNSVKDNGKRGTSGLLFKELCHFLRYSNPSLFKFKFVHFDLLEFWSANLAVHPSLHRIRSLELLPHIVSSTSLIII